MVEQHGHERLLFDLVVQLEIRGGQHDHQQRQHEDPDGAEHRAQGARDRAEAALLAAVEIDGNRDQQNQARHEHDGVLKSQGRVIEMLDHLVVEPERFE